MKLPLKISLFILITFVLVIACVFFYLTRGLESGSRLVINEVDLGSPDDGIYNGKYNAGRWSNEVNVIIEDDRITDIEVVKDILLVKPDIREELINMVKDRQNTDVDVISGATVTCKAYLKAIENALQK